MTTRQEILDFARSLIGTPFHHQGRLPKVGLDCVGLLVVVARHFGFTFHDLEGYPRQPDGVTLERELNHALEPIEPVKAQPGDVVTFWIRRPSMIQHTAILSDVGMIHTWALVRRVTEHRIDEQWRSQVVSTFRFPGVDPTPYPKPVGWPAPPDPRLLAMVEQQKPPKGCCD